ncbi:TPA: YcgJ family protein [Salmonella enterica subsp. enterica serovar Potsdam]
MWMRVFMIQELSMKSVIMALFLVPGLFMASAGAKQPESAAVYSPGRGVLCDQYFCADSTGISFVLTKHYAGSVQLKKLKSMGDFDRTAFTFSNGIFCDVKERLCRQDHYFGNDGKRSGVVNQHFTKILFGSK